MTHSPPIPPGNQAPYPRVEPPHAHAAPKPVKRQKEASIADRALDAAPLLAGAAILGAAAAAAAVFVRSRRAAASAAARKAAKQSAAKSAPKDKPAKAPATKRSASGDDAAIRGPRDASRIAMGEDHEVRYWTGKFGVDREALQHAVDAVGNGADAVERELRS